MRRPALLFVPTAVFLLGAERCDQTPADDPPAESDETCFPLWIDFDGDGYGTGEAQEVCGEQATSGEGLASQGGDCDDADAEINPGAEVCETEVDLNCDGEVASEPVEGFFLDWDGDGYFGLDSEPCDCADLAADEDACSDEPGDCDDTDERAFPGAAPNDSTTACMLDRDGDGWGMDEALGDIEAGTDCDDANDESCPDCEVDGDGDGRNDECDLEFDIDCDGEVAVCAPPTYADCWAMLEDGQTSGALDIDGTDSVEVTCTSSGELVVDLALLDALNDRSAITTLAITRRYPSGTPEPTASDVPASLTDAHITMSSVRNFSYNGYSACSELRIALPWSFVGLQGSLDGAALSGGTGPDDDGTGTWGTSYNSLGVGHVMFGVRDQTGTRHTMKGAGEWGRDFEASSWSNDSSAAHPEADELILEYCDDGLSGEQVEITNLSLLLLHPSE